MPPDTFTIIGSVIGTGLAVGISLAVLILRSTSRLDTGRREVQRRFDAAMDTFRTEMQRLAARQSHVEGRLDERGGAAAD